MRRVVEPELLDSLPPDHPEALRNRRDLRLINGIMGNHRWLTRVLPGLVAEAAAGSPTAARIAGAAGGSARAPAPILELGSGMGELAARLESAGVPVDGLDLWPRPPAWPAQRAWHQADLQSFDGYSRYPVVIANLILHQFTDDELGRLGERLRAGPRIIVACEPARLRQSHFFLAVGGPLLGACRVTRHDARVSVTAGFLRDELPRLLGLLSGGWDVTCSPGGIGAIRLIARRRP